MMLGAHVDAVLGRLAGRKMWRKNLHHGNLDVPFRYQYPITIKLMCP
jgi:hypothetical protein